MWPWERLDGLPRWHRLPWQTTWIEVRGSVDGLPCALGRGPRSASGSDLRPWLVSRDAEALATVAVTEGERWMGEGRPEHPWQVARHLLRSDLRPAVLTVDQGVLRVGFRGPASAALGRLASQWVPGGLSEVTYESVALPCGPLEHCEDSADDVVAVLPQGSLRRRT